MTMQARKLVRRLIPALTTDWRKGQHGKQLSLSACVRAARCASTEAYVAIGRVGVIGGSFEYTGAPYYAGISCLKTVRSHDAIVYQ